LENGQKTEKKIKRKKENTKGIKKRKKGRKEKKKGPNRQSFIAVPTPRTAFSK